MKKKYLDQYVGKLNSKQITEGINAARRNVRRLIKDARMLVDNKRYASAVFLSILAIEEFGKQDILRDLAIASSDEEVKEIWRNYRTHTKKTLNWEPKTNPNEGIGKLIKWVGDNKNIF